MIFLGTQERVQNSSGKRAISVRAIEVLLYIDITKSKFIPNSKVNFLVSENLL